MKRKKTIRRRIVTRDTYASHNQRSVIYTLECGHMLRRKFSQDAKGDTIRCKLCEEEELDRRENQEEP